MKKDIIKFATVNVVLTVAYVFLVALFLNSAETIFSNLGKTILIPIVMLLLFIFSASICGFLMLGRPILWYLEGKKREAVELFIYSLGMLFLILIAVFIVMILI